MHHHLSSSSSSSSSSCFTYHALFLFLLHFAPFSSSSFSVSYYHIPTSISSSFLLPLLLPLPALPSVASTCCRRPGEPRLWLPRASIQDAGEGLDTNNHSTAIHTTCRDYKHYTTITKRSTNIHRQPFCNHKDQQ